MGAHPPPPAPPPVNHDELEALGAQLGQGLRALGIAGARAAVDRVRAFLRGPEGEDLRQGLRTVDALSGGQIGRVVAIVAEERRQPQHQHQNPPKR
jgi:hypothetical protein